MQIEAERTPGQIDAYKAILNTPLTTPRRMTHEFDYGTPDTIWACLKTRSGVERFGRFIGEQTPGTFSVLCFDEKNCLDLSHVETFSTVEEMHAVWMLD